ncbi:acyl-CoA desaturase [Pseudactinotalea sp. HY158]|uniref:fatty acid desaturase family protein n=1 Tax=Pseudactinotalea sp. HY158 TaxID=2654547 RepID=UPI00129CD38F|nr:acyl-CoA desaturase [Pseudactinotalea sp. HY158]QGH71128.1 acyl-CoA desaturase [Pseudactinotalea sp. HY158]
MIPGDAHRARPRSQYVAAYLDLSERVHAAGLMRRRYGFYWAMILLWSGATVAILVAVGMLADTWYQLLLAALLGLAMAQVAFLGHEAAHQEIFRTRGWNEWTARVLSGVFTGLSYGWWVDKHGRHHANPNKDGSDPDVDSSVLAFTPASTDRRTGIGAALIERQGYYFVPLLFLEGFHLHVASIRTAVAGRGVRHRWTEILFLTARLGGYLVFVFLALPPGIAFAFVGVQVSVFGVFLGGAFAPNHIGMPTVPKDVRLDFLRRQVHMSRGIRGGPLVHFLMGGLEYQVEHHLFPKAPRPNLPALRVAVLEHCARDGIPYTEATLPEAYATIIRYLNQVGTRRRDLYTCPLVREYRG